MIRLKIDLKRLDKYFINNLSQGDKDVVKAENELNGILIKLGNVQLDKHEALLVKCFLHKYLSLVNA